MAKTALLGGNGLVGSQIMCNLISTREVEQVNCIGRKYPPIQHEKLSSWTGPHILRLWPKHVAETNPGSDIFFCALTISSSEVGGRKNQRFIEYDAVLKIASAARKAGTKVFVLCSIRYTALAGTVKWFKMKRELEKAIENLGFEKMVIVRAPVMVGARDEGTQASGKIIHALGNFQGFWTHPTQYNYWERNAQVVGRAAIIAGFMALDGQLNSPITVIEGAELQRFGKKLWHKTQGLRGPEVRAPPVKVAMSSL